MNTEQAYSPLTTAQIADKLQIHAENAPGATAAGSTHIHNFLLGLASTMPTRVIRSRFRALRQALSQRHRGDRAAIRAIAAINEFLFYLED